MSTHNIGFYEDLTKIIFELSANIIKYAHYLFCCWAFLSGLLISRHKYLCGEQVGNPAVINITRLFLEYNVINLHTSG